mgnify:CR=1 FL=1
MPYSVDRCFQILELEAGATFEQVKQARREMAKVWHPDRFATDSKLRQKADERMKKVNRAYEVLEVWFASGAHRVDPDAGTPNWDGTSSSEQSEQAERPGQEAREQDAPHPEPPRQSPAQSQKPQERDPAIGVAAVVVVAIIAAGIGWFIVSGNSDRESAREVSYRTETVGAQGEAITAGPPAPAPVPTEPRIIAHEVDEKNGFKEFKLGMSREAAYAIAQPTEAVETAESAEAVFTYRGTPVNRIGDYVVAEVALRFFQNQLFRIDLSFPRNGTEIHEAFKVQFGEAYETDGWTRGGLKLTAEEWRGRKNSAVMLAVPGQFWDGAAIYDRSLSAKARKYAEDTPLRAATAFAARGFRELQLGTPLEASPWGYRVVSTDSLAHTFRAEFRCDYQCGIGPYVVDSVTGEYFEGRLYRIDLKFSHDVSDVYRAFEQGYQPLAPDLTWSVGEQSISARSGERDGIRGTILARPGSGEAPVWDMIAIYDMALWRAAERYVANAPARAAADF